MFKLAVTTVAALALASSVSGLLVPRKTPPPGWATAWLEDYNTYHIRYLALDCQAQHNTPFFDQCCHPLLAGQVLSQVRPAQCIPSATAMASATAAEATSTVTTPADDPECTDDGSSDDTTDDDDDDDECDDGDDEPEASSSAAPATTSAAPAAIVNAAPDPPAATTSSSSTTHHTSSSHTSSADASSSTSSSDSSDSSVVTGGFATFFFQNGVAGACGTVHSDSDLIAAIDVARYGNDGDVSPLCGQKVQITNDQNGKQVTVTIADACPTCDNSNSIDLSQGAFDQIADESTGIVPISWVFV